ncbi:Syd protein [Streptomyces sp. NBRC 110611]|nr:Syd protein [Streptomyces sp. NBRC 110611]
MPRNCRPAHLKDPLPVPEPVPVAGCDVCGALARQRAEAYTAGDKSKVIDCNVELRRHPHPRTLKAARP